MDNKYRLIKSEELLQTLPSSLAKPEFVWLDFAKRRRISLQVLGGKIGFFEEKTNSLIEIEEENLDSFPAIEEEIVSIAFAIKPIIKKIWTLCKCQKISITNFDSGVEIVLELEKKPEFDNLVTMTNWFKEIKANIYYSCRDNLFPISTKNKTFITSNYTNLPLELSCDIFIQPTKEGMDRIIDEIRVEILLHHGEKKPNICDIYSGFGIYSFSILDIISTSYCYEGDANMTKLIDQNSRKHQLNNKIKAISRDLFINPISSNELNKFSMAILNPPRNGALPQIKEIIRSKLKSVIYISCNPKSFARDVNLMIDNGFELAKIKAIDQFHKSQYFEIFAHFIKK